MDIDSWKLSKLDQPISPMEVVYNGSQSMHAVDDKGVMMKAQDHAQALQIR